MPLLQAARSCASLLFNLNLFMSSCTHSCQVFLPLPLPLTPSTTKLLHADTQSVGSLRSTCPYHLSLPRVTTSEIPSMPKRLNSSRTNIFFNDLYGLARPYQTAYKKGIIRISV